MPSRKILIVTYYWPPSGGVGVQRWLHFAKNLKAMGWEPIVYTPSNPQFEIKDEKLLEAVKDIKVIKKTIWEPFSLFHKITGNREKNNVQQGLVLEKSTRTWKDKLIIWIRGNLFIPDPRVFWVKSSVEFLMDYLRKEKIDTIITTGPPHSMHLIGLGLKRLKTGVRWVADFRDPWSDWDILPKLNTGLRAMKRHQHYEQQVLGQADAVMTVSKRLGEVLGAKRVSAGSINVIANGVADERYHNFQIHPHAEDKFIIGYYGMLNELRDPTSLWKLLERLCNEHETFAEKLEIRLGGIVSQSIRDRLLTSRQLRDKVVFPGYIPHEEVFSEYRKCNVLLLLLNKSDNAKWILPVKFFEYLSSGRAILGLGPVESDLGDLFKRKEIGEIYEAEQTELIQRFILANFNGEYPLNEQHFKNLLHTYSRSNQASELSKLLEKL